MNVNGASIIIDLASSTPKALCIGVDLSSIHWPPLFAKMLLIISLPPTNERQWSVNNFWQCILDDRRAMQLHQPIIIVLAASMRKSATDNIATTF